MPGRVAIVGTGAFGRFCIDAYRRSGDIEVVAAVDSDAEALKQVDGSLRRELDWRPVVADQSIEVLHLATPPWVRGEVARAALQAGKSVFCEKPLALTLDEADAMIAAARERGVALGIDYVMRHLPAYRLLEACAASELFGALRTVSFQNFAQAVPRGHWFWDRAKSGGILVEHGVHFFDAYGRLAGRPAQVQATTPRAEAVDVLVRYESGVVGRFYHEFAFPREVERAEGISFFDHGYVQIEGWIPVRVHGRVLAPPERVDEIGRRLRLAMHVSQDTATGFTVSFPDRDRSYGDAIVAGMREMIRRHRDPSFAMTVSAEDGRASLELALTARRAADTGVAVTPGA